MKFYCDSCGAKYSISDEKVRGKILKVRCKKCTHVITVREARVPAEAPAAPSATAAEQGWYYAINGVSHGPMRRDALVARFASGELGDATYLWRESFEAWKPAREVGAFAEAIEGVEARRGRVSTLQVSGALEAIGEGARERPEEEEAGQVPAASTDAPMAARMERLRERLRQEERGPEPELLSEPGGAEGPGAFEEAPSAAASLGRGVAERDQLDSDTLLPGFGRLEGSESVIDFSRIETKREDEDASNIFGSTQPVVDAPRNDFSGVTNSLLIQFKSIKKQGRGQRVALIAALTVLVVGLGGTATFLAARNVGKGMDPASTLREEEQKEDLVFLTYSPEELAFSLGVEEEIIRADEGSEPAAEQQEADEPEEPSRVGAKTRRDPPAKEKTPPRTPAAKPEKRTVLASAGPDLSTGRSKRTRGPALPTKKPGAEGPALGRPGTLSKKEALKGFRRIRRSVASCYQSQMRRGLPIDAPKVHLTVSIQPDGSVNGLALDPKSLKHSEFDVCMNRHQRQGRWRFAAYGGKPLKIKHTYVLQ